MATRIAVINHGILQQVDTPQNLYDRPDNLFVAGFIGSPAMNFFNSHIRKGDGKLFVDAGSFKVEVPQDREGALRNYVGKPVHFGVRPEDIHDPKFAPPGIIAQSIDGKIDVTELMGNEIFVHMANNSHEFIARVDPRSDFRAGESVQVVFNMANIHIYEHGENGSAVR